jgi:adrenodoxin-NADP+ reductase
MLPKCVQLRFLLNPTRFEPRGDSSSTSLGSVVCERNRLEGEPGIQRAKGTGEFETIPAQLALVSIGYKGLALRGTEQWFDDERGVIRNDRGRVDEGTSKLGGLYAAGWLKRGPSGTIGTNIADAKETASTIVADLAEAESRNNRDGPDLRSMLRDRGHPVVEWVGYRRIEKEERARRRSEHQPREKIVTLEEQLAAALV